MVRIVFALVLVLAGCDRMVDRSATVRISFPGVSVNLPAHSLNRIAGAETMGWGLEDPSSISDFNCYLVTVSGSEDEYQKHYFESYDQSRRILFGAVAGMNAAGSELKIELDSAKARLFSVFGFASANGASDCVSVDSVLEPGHYSHPYFLGQTVADLEPGDQTLTIKIGWDMAEKMSGSDILKFNETDPGGDTTPPPAAVLTFDLGADYHFGPQATGVLVSKTLTIINSGDYTASLMAASGLAAPFSFTGGTYPGGGTCGMNLAPSGSCTVYVQYEPTTVASHFDTLQIDYFDGAVLQSATFDFMGEGRAGMSLGFGACTLRNAYTSIDWVPGPMGETVYGDPSSLSEGYISKTVIDSSNFTATQAACPDTELQPLMDTYCAMGFTEPVQWQAVIFNTTGGVSTTGCAASGCANHACP